MTRNPAVLAHDRISAIRITVLCLFPVTGTICFLSLRRLDECPDVFFALAQQERIYPLAGRFQQWGQHHLAIDTGFSDRLGIRIFVTGMSPDNDSPSPLPESL